MPSSPPAGDTTSIQVGYYQLKKEMKAADAFEILSNPANLVKNTVTIPEGQRVVDDRRHPRREDRLPCQGSSRRCWTTPRRSGCPTTPSGNPEGYLFPSTYDFGPKEKPVDMLKKMVARWQQAADDAGLEEAAPRWATRRTR